MAWHEAYGIPQIDYIISNEKISKEMQEENIFGMKLNRLWAENNLTEVERVKTDYMKQK